MNQGEAGRTRQAKAEDDAEVDPGDDESLSGILDRAELDPARRIFVNRSLRMDQIRQIGFDMDYTLLPYRKRSMEELSYRLTAQKLVEKHGFPAEILELPYDPSFVVRGLVVDKRRGNIIKMNSHGHVGRAYHGRRPMPKDERRGLYRDQKLRLASPKYHWIDTLFALPEGVLYANIIDHLELVRKEPEADRTRLFDQIRASIDEAHRDGSLKAIVKADPGAFVELDPDLPSALHKLRSAGKRLFVLTNSLWDYTHRMMSFLLDGKLPEYPSWTNYFDLILVGADKPTFFTEKRDFFEVDKRSGNVSTTPAQRFERQHVYQGGSLVRFEELIALAGEQILYVGDHIYGDIIRSKKDTLWRTALIITELEDELRMAPTVGPLHSELTRLETESEAFEEEITELRLKISALEAALDDRPERAEAEVTELSSARRRLRLAFDTKRRSLRAMIDRREELAQRIDRAFNPYWGSVFKEGHETSRFGRQVESYACLYTSRVSNFLYYSPQQYFRSPRHWMAHEKA